MSNKKCGTPTTAKEILAAILLISVISFSVVMLDQPSWLVKWKYSDVKAP